MFLNHTKIRVEWRIVNVNICNMSSNVDPIFLPWKFESINSNGTSMPYLGLHAYDAPLMISKSNLFLGYTYNCNCTEYV